MDRTLALWTSIAPRVRRAIENADTFRDGYPASSGGAGGSGESRTQRIAERHVDKGDPHGALHREMERVVERLADLVDRLAPSNAAADHLASKASDACPAGRCESCFRDGGHLSPTRTAGSRMCRWCEETARTLALDLPPLMLVQRHNRGQRITDRDVRIATAGR